ncbi:MAG TPA: hypothetical protein DHW49_04945 [Anaerolineae bacterium]|nr:hypothetical protein [Anaerolineae bacterium]
MNWLRENNQQVIRIIGSILAVVLLVFLLRGQNSEEMLFALKRVSLGYFLLAVVSLFISRLFTTLRWHVLLKSAGVEISFFRSLILTFTGLFASNFLPTTIGGDVVRLGGAMQMGYDRAITLASLIVDRLIGMVGMFLALPFGIGTALSFNPDSLHTITIASFHQKMIGFIKNTVNAFRIWLHKPFSLISSLLFTIGNMAFIFLTLYILIIGIDRFVSYWLIAGIWSLTYFITLIPVSINGFGIQELSITVLLVEAGGLSHAESLTIAVLIRAIFIITSLPGAFSFPSILASINKQETSNNTSSNV